MASTQTLYSPAPSPRAPVVADVKQQSNSGMLRLQDWMPIGTVLSSYGIVIALFALVSLVVIGDPNFLSFKNIVNMLGQWAPAGIMAVAATYVIIVGGFDLSVASAFSCCAIVAAALGSIDYPPTFAFTMAVLAGLVSVRRVLESSESVVIQEWWP